MKNLFKNVSIVSFLILSPVIVFAAPPIGGVGVCDSATAGLGKFICQIQQLLNWIIPLLLALGVVYFVWGVVQYVIADSEEAKSKGRDSIIYGLIGLAVIVGLWGLVAIVGTTFGIEAGNSGNKTPTSSQLKGLLPQ